MVARLRAVGLGGLRGGGGALRGLPRAGGAEGMVLTGRKEMLRVLRGDKGC